MVEPMLVVKEARSHGALSQPHCASNIELKMKEYDKLAIHPNYPEQKVWIGNDMPPSQREQMTQFVLEHLCNFAWQTEDMLGISLDVAEHKLTINPSFKLVRQISRQFGEVAFTWSIELCSYDLKFTP